jgi:2-haloacid dehalogenase
MSATSPAGSRDALVPTHPSVLVFDVNETLIDIESMAPLFTRIFGDSRVLREWFADVVMYSMTITLSDCYVDFFSLAQGVLQMVAQIHRVRVTDEDLRAVADGMRMMPAHGDVTAGLGKLREEGYRLVTLTNSPHSPHGPSPLEYAGLGGFFERQFSVDTFRVFKPAAQVYRHVARQLNVPPSACMMVSAHVWDTIGAQNAGFSSALLTRPGNAALPISGLPQPTIIAWDLHELAKQLRAMKPDER